MMGGAKPKPKPTSDEDDCRTTVRIQASRLFHILPLLHSTGIDFCVLRPTTVHKTTTTFLFYVLLLFAGNGNTCLPFFPLGIVAKATNRDFQIADGGATDFTHPVRATRTLRSIPAATVANLFFFLYIERSMLPHSPSSLACAASLPSHHRSSSTSQSFSSSYLESNHTNNDVVHSMSLTQLLSHQYRYTAANTNTSSATTPPRSATRTSAANLVAILDQALEISCSSGFPPHHHTYHELEVNHHQQQQ